MFADDGNLPGQAGGRLARGREIRMRNCPHQSRSPPNTVLEEIPRRKIYRRVLRNIAIERRKYGDCFNGATHTCIHTHTHTRNGTVATSPAGAGAPNGGLQIGKQS